MTLPPARADALGLRTGTAAALVVVVSFAMYWPALHAGFVGDDFMILHRLRALAGPADALRFFRGEFFEYYRPLPFLLHAMDWAIAGPDPRQFHLTNLVLHAADAILVLLIGRALSPRSLAGPLAALLFALHASNHEAVLWISARFDLLATLLSLAAIWWTVRGGAGSRVGSPILFFAALLSKESAVALPAAVAGLAVFRLRASTAGTIRRLLPWLAALALYAVFRHLAGGVSAVGGASRLPKLIAFILMLGGLLLLADERWIRVRSRLAGDRSAVMGAGVVGLACLAALAAAGGRAGQLAADKLAVAGFAVFNLGSPLIDLFDQPFYLDPQAPMYWVGGVIALVVAGLVVLALWRPLLDDDRMWFLGTLLAAALLPVSALTEGTRYLYLPSAAVSLMAATLVAELRGRRRAAALAFAAVVLLVSASQIWLKERDWVWAGRMTAEGAQLVDDALPPACGGEHVVFLTEPVAVHGVYTHFNYETFERPRGCTPAVFDVLVRVMRVDGTIDVSWDGPSRIVINAPAYRGNFVASEDLRHFDRPIRAATRTSAVGTPLGELTAEPIGGAERLTLTIAPGIRGGRLRFFYYSDGRMRALPAGPN